MAEVNQLIQGIYLDMLHGKNPYQRRIKVEPGEQAESVGRLLRLDYEFSFASGNPRIIKIEAPIPWKLNFESVTIDQNTLYYRKFLQDALTVSATFDTTITPFKPTGVEGVAAYTPQLAITTHSVAAGASITLNGDVAITTQRFRTASVSVQKASVSGNVGDAQLLGAGTYFLVLTNLAGESGTTTGVLQLRIEELPNGILNPD